MDRARYVLLPLVLLLAIIPNLSGAAAAAGKQAPRPVPCFLALVSGNPVSCYPASAATQLRELKVHPVFNPAPTVSQLTHLRLRQVMVVGPVWGGGVPMAPPPLPKGTYFPFGKYVHPHYAMPNTSPANPKWLVLMEAPVGTPDSVVQGRPWGRGGPNLYSSPTDVPTTEAWVQHGNRRFIAVSNEPMPLIRKVLLALLTAQG